MSPDLPKPPRKRARPTAELVADLRKDLSELRADLLAALRTRLPEEGTILLLMVAAELGRDKMRLGLRQRITAYLNRHAGTAPPELAPASLAAMPAPVAAPSSATLKAPPVTIDELGDPLAELEPASASAKPPVATQTLRGLGGKP